jgi:hypothetical protein
MALFKTLTNNNKIGNYTPYCSTQNYQLRSLNSTKII